MSVLRDLGRGARLFLRGFRTWGRSPRAMLLGAIPPLIVGLVFVGVLVLVLTRVQDVVTALTPFANGWEEGWAATTRLLLAVAMVGAIVALGVVLFAVVAMPAATAGATLLLRTLRGEPIDAVPTTA